MKIAFAGSFAVRLMDSVRSHLSMPCEMVADDSEPDVLSKLGDVDVIVSMGFSKAMAAAAPRLSLVQVPGAGLDRIDRSALAANVRLANAYGHEAGIAEYIMGAMLGLTRSFGRLDASLRRGRWDS
jgi:phosphoglycerate dehydrogenase-like enzyme